METSLYRSQMWLRENRKGPKASKSRIVTQVFPSGPDPDFVHFLVVTEEGLSIFEDIITTCLTHAPVLDGLDYVGDPNIQTFMRTPIFLITFLKKMIGFKNILIHLKSNR